MSQIKGLLKNIDLDNPQMALETVAKRGQDRRGHLTASQREELIELARNGMSAGDLKRRFGISFNAVYRYQKKMGLR